MHAVHACMHLGDDWVIAGYLFVRLHPWLAATCQGISATSPRFVVEAYRISLGIQL